MKLLTFKEHFLELKSRIIKLIIIYAIFFALSYYFKDYFYDILLAPLRHTFDSYLNNVIYTGLAEAFFAYIKLSAFFAFIFSLPFISLQIYLFIKDALSPQERKIAGLLLSAGPILFWSGGFFTYYFVMPKAFIFFTSFENDKSVIPILLQARISEYINLTTRFITAFGVAFQLPIILILLSLMKIINAQDLIKHRRTAIVINFILGGILTPPDVISQFALAIPMVLLYELTIVICKFIENRKNNA